MFRVMCKAVDSGIIDLLPAEGTIIDIGAGDGAYGPLLGFYSLGLAIPMLIVGYSSQLIQNRIKGVLRHDAALRYITGGVLVAFGLHSIIKGNVAF